MPSQPPAADALIEAFRTLRACTDPQQREQLRDQLIEQHLPLVRALARRFEGRGEPFDDLLSTATLGLIKAVDRFDPEMGTRFTTFATPTILGELRRYFRDKSWALKVPRRMQELNRAVSTTREQLTQRLGRVPTYAEIAEELNQSEEAVIEAVESGQGYDLLSFEQLGPSDDEAGDGPGAIDPSLSSTLGRVHLQQAMDAVLDEREQRILKWYYFDEDSQTEIAEREEVSQMHISRLIGRARAKLRRYLQS